MEHIKTTEANQTQTVPVYKNTTEKLWKTVAARGCNKT